MFYDIILIVFLLRELFCHTVAAKYTFSVEQGGLWVSD